MASNSAASICFLHLSDGEMSTSDRRVEHDCKKKKKKKKKKKAKRNGVVKDIRLMIAKMIWESREQVLYK